MGFHWKSTYKSTQQSLPGHRALVIGTSQATRDVLDPKTGEVLKVGPKTGVYASELTEAYYAFLDAEMTVHVASVDGRAIPFERLSLQPIVRTSADSRYLKDAAAQEKTAHPLSVGDLHASNYSIIFLAGGWGAAYDFAQSDALAAFISQAAADEAVIGAVCHGVLGLVNAHKPDGSPLLEGVEVTGVTNRQLKQLFVGGTPLHPETELRRVGSKYQMKRSVLDVFAHHVVVSDRLITGQNQRAGVEVAERAMERVNS
jgi:putative intracellular protease/amidase